MDLETLAKDIIDGPEKILDFDRDTYLLKNIIKLNDIDIDSGEQFQIEWLGKTFNINKDICMLNVSDAERYPRKYYQGSKTIFGNATDGTLDITTSEELKAGKTYNFHDLILREGSTLNITGEGDITLLLEDGLKMEVNSKIICVNPVNIVVFARQLFIQSGSTIENSSDISMTVLETSGISKLETLETNTEIKFL